VVDSASGIGTPIGYLNAYHASRSITSIAAGRFVPREDRGFEGSTARSRHLNTNPLGARPVRGRIGWWTAAPERR